MRTQAPRIGRQDPDSPRRWRPELEPSAPKCYLPPSLAHALKDLT
jgi:hypothetical protein